MLCFKGKFPLIALCLGFFMVIMDASVINVALPSIASDLAADLSALQWVVVAYTLSFCCLLLLAGYLADQAGAKKILLAGLSLFLVASFACALASSVSFLILFRLVQGIAFFGTVSEISDNFVKGMFVAFLVVAALFLAGFLLTFLNQYRFQKV